jgi:hypothetical protein
MAQFAATGMRTVGQTPGGQQARVKAAAPRTGDALVDAARRAVAVFQEMQTGLAQGRHR